MINANELRRGNKLLLDGKIVSVIALAKDDIVVDGFGGSEEAFQPIPLTVELLKKCGLIETDKYNSGNEQGDSLYELQDVIIAIDEDGDFYWWNHIEDDSYYSHRLKKIKYLHKLQNLYFDLTDKELNIDL